MREFMNLTRAEERANRWVRGEEQGERAESRACVRESEVGMELGEWTASRARCEMAS